MSSGSSGKRVMVPDPSRSIACLTRRIVVVLQGDGGEVCPRVVEGDGEFFTWGQTDTTVGVGLVE